MKWLYKKCNRLHVISFVFVLLTSILFLNYMNNKEQSIIGDEATYIAQAYSFAFDGDNVYTEADLERYCEEIHEVGPNDILFLNSHEGVLSYSKPYIYALVSSLFVKLFGLNGINVFNLLCLYGIIWIGYLYLRKYNKDSVALIFSIFFYVASICLAYIFEVYLDLFNAFILALSIFLYEKYNEVAKSENTNRNQWLYLAFSAVLIGVSTYQRSPFIFFAGAFFLDLLYKRKWKEAIMFALLSGGFWFALSGYHYYEHGSFSPYTGERYYFSNSWPYSENFNGKWFRTDVGSVGAIVTRSLYALSDIKGFAHNMFYFLVGRQTGLFVYFPGILLILFNTKKNILKKRWYLILGLIAHILFFMLEGYYNYYGGSQSLGNRYIIQIFPAFIFFVEIIRKQRVLISGILTVLLFKTFLWCSPTTSLHHIVAFRERPIMKILPIEYTQLENIVALEPSNKYQIDNDTYLWMGWKTHYYYMVEPDGSFWTEGTKEVPITISTKEKIDSITFEISPGWIENKVLFSDGYVLDLDKKDIFVEVEYVPEFKAEVYDRFYYEFSIKPEHSFIPSEVRESNDSRDLGVKLRGFSYKTGEENENK